MGIKDSDDYEEGNFFGNTSLNAISIYEKVTYNLSNLVSRIKVQYQNGEEIEFEDYDLESLQTGITTTQKYGRCYQLDVFKNQNISLYSTQIYINKDLELYIREQLIWQIEEFLYRH